MMAQIFYDKEIMKYERVDIPVINESEVLIKVKAVGICGSDIGYFFGKTPLETPTKKGPIILGHEISGEIAEAGKLVSEKGFFKPGDRVTLNPAQPCYNCAYCRMAKPNLCLNLQSIGANVNGGYAGYLKAHYSSIVLLPDTVDYMEGAMSEPLSCACYAVERLGIKPGDFVVVIGSGAIGLMMTQLVRVGGASRVALIGTSDYRLKMAKQMGVDYIYNVRDKASPFHAADPGRLIKELTNGLGAEKVIVPTANARAYSDAFAVSAKSSSILFFGFPGEKDIIEVPACETTMGEKNILFSWLAPYGWNTTMKLLAEKKIPLEKLITHQFPLEKLEDGIRFMHSPAEEKIKGMILVD